MDAVERVRADFGRVALWFNRTVDDREAMSTDSTANGIPDAHVSLA